VTLWSSPCCLVRNLPKKCLLLLEREKLT
jgi:hypothetical protein